MIKKALAVGALALAAVVPAASAAPKNPVGTENAVVNQVCNHYDYYVEGFYNQAVFFASVGDTAKYNDAVFHLVWTIVVHDTYC